MIITRTTSPNEETQEFLRPDFEAVDAESDDSKAAIGATAVKGAAEKTKGARVFINVHDNDLDLMGLYYEDISRYPLLTKEDEVNLAQEIEAGKAAKEKLDAGVEAFSDAQIEQLESEFKRGEDAKQQFINSNLRLVVSIAKRYTGQGLELADLIQEGNIGLEHAVDKFEWRRGFKFSTYGTNWIKQAVTRAIINKSASIRIPVHMSDRISQINRIRSEQLIKTGEYPDSSFVARELGYSELEVEEALRASDTVVTASLDEDIKNDSNSARVDFIGDVKSGFMLESVINKTAVDQLMRNLDSTEAKIISLTFGLNDGEVWPQSKIANLLGIKTAQVSEIKKRALYKLKSTYYADIAQ